MSRRLPWTAFLLVLAFAPPADAKEPAAPTIVFLDAERAGEAFCDESVEPYHSLLQPAEMEAKTGGEPLKATDLPAQRAECRARYRNAARAFSDEEKSALTTLVERLHAAWAPLYPRIADLPWSFLGTEDVIEGGLPHTRGHSIVIPRSVGTAIVASLDHGESAMREQISLLAHEQTHVLQRKEPGLFAPLYRAWGFVQVEGLAPAAPLLSRHVVNPDGVRTEWVFALKEGRTTAYIHPLVAFRGESPPYRMPQDLEMIAVDLVKDRGTFRAKEDTEGGVAVRPLPSVTAYVAHFGGIFENFHPNEIFAVLFAAMVAKDSFHGGDLPRLSEAAGKDFSKLRAWCKKSLVRKTPAPVR